jgi:uncharacterized protein YjbI with pentapeptide repeats
VNAYRETGVTAGETAQKNMPNMKFEIKNWITGKVMFTIEGDNWKLAFCAAVKAGQKFDQADLSEKDFSGIELDCKDSRFDNSRFDNSRFYNSRFYNSSFYNSSFADKKIIGQRPFFFIGPLGSNQRHLMAVNTEKGIHLQTGCFSGSIEEFTAAVKNKHAKNEHGKEYLAALVLIELHFKLWGAQ